MTFFIYYSKIVGKVVITIGFLRFLEGIRLPFFDFIFSLITHLGEETVFIAIALFIFWCVSKKNGYYILAVGFIGTMLNQILKITFRIERPWVLDKDFTIVESARAEATGYSFPSGHTQIAVGTFGAIAYTTKQKWLRILSIVLCVLIPFSRMYLGVHTPLDVGVSIVIAIILIFAVRPIINKIEERPVIMFFFLGVFLVFAISFILFTELYQFPDNINEENLSSTIKNAYMIIGALFGILISYPIEKTHINFETDGKWYIQIFKFVLGLLLLLGIKSGLKPLLNLIFKDIGIAHAIRYMIIVVFAVTVWPLTFKYFKRIENYLEGKHEKPVKNTKRP